MNLKNLSKKQIMALLITCLALLLVLNALMASVVKKDESSLVDYKNDTGASLVEEASVEYDRVVCYKVENFVRQFIDSFDDRYEKATYMDYYKKSTTEEYRKHNSKSKYKKQSDNFYSKIITYSTIGTKRGDQLVTEKSLYNQDMIDKIYKLEDDKDYYICSLKLRNDEMSYIGLYFENNNAYIFYIE